MNLPGVTLKTTTGEIVDGPRLRAARTRIGTWILTRRPVAGFIQDQGVRLLDVTDAGFRGIEVRVEGLDADGNTIRRTLSVDDVRIPGVE